MNKAEYRNAVSEVKAANPVEYFELLKPIREKRYQALKAVIGSASELIKAYEAGLVDRYEQPANRLYKELRYK